MAPRDTTSLHIAVVTNTPSVMAWQRSIISNMTAMDFIAQPVDLIAIAAEPGRSWHLLPRWSGIRGLLIALCQLVDGLIFKLSRREKDPFVKSSLSGNPAVRMHRREPHAPDKNKWLLRKITELCPDLIISLDGAAQRTDLAAKACLGVWQLTTGPILDQMLSGDTTTWAALTSYTTDNIEGTVLDLTKTKLGNMSYRLNTSRLAWTMCEFIPRRLKQLWNQRQAGIGMPSVRRETPQGNFSPPNQRLGNILRLFCRLSATAVVTFLRHLCRRDVWALKIRRTTDDRSVELPHKRGTYLADPFLIEYEGVRHIFYEDFSFKKKKGVICTRRIGDDFSLGESQVALSRPYHLSYPYLFPWDGELWMIPESAANRTVELYRCINFPAQWVLDTVLLSDLCARDTAILHRDNLFWLFTCISPKNTSTADELFVFYSQTFRGPWLPHPLNPVVADVRRARCAGAIVKTDEGLFRPCQDCSMRYGGQILFNRIDRLTTEDYLEQDAPASSLSYAGDMYNVHTVSKIDGLEAIDIAVAEWRQPILS